MTMPLFGGRTTPALDLLGRVAEALGPLVDRVVFIGGAIAPLLQTHPVSPRVRPTKDVDGVAITTTYLEFHTLQEQLRARGFVQRAMEADTSRHAHRWTTPTGILFDLVPAGTHLGGSGSPLGQVAVDTAVAIALHTSNGAAMVIRHADAPTFLALKWAAFEDRGGEICWAAMTLRTSSRSSHHAHHCLRSAHPLPNVCKPCCERWRAHS